MDDFDAAAQDIGALGSALAPRLKELGTLIAPLLERALWPDGAPEVITWSVIWERHAEHVRGVRDELARGDGQAAELAHTEELLRQMEALGERCPSDAIVFGDAAMPAKLSVAALFAASTDTMLALAEAIAEGSQRPGAARLLSVLLRDVTIRTASALQLCGQLGPAAQLDALLPEIVAFEERLDAASREPASVVPTAASGEETAALLERLAVEVRRVAPELAEVIDREIFDGAPPARASFSAIQVAIDAKQYGDVLPAEVRRVHSMIADADRILMPGGDAPLGARALLDGAADSIAGMAARLRALPRGERDEIAPIVELQARLFLLGVVSVAHATGREALVSELAAAVGLDASEGSSD